MIKTSAGAWWRRGRAGGVAYLLGAFALATSLNFATAGLAQQWTKPKNFVAATNAKPVPIKAKVKAPHAPAGWAEIEQHRVAGTEPPRPLTWRTAGVSDGGSRVTHANFETEVPASRMPTVSSRASGGLVMRASSHGGFAPKVARAHMRLAQFVPIDPFDDPFGDRSEDTTPINIQQSDQSNPFADDPAGTGQLPGSEGLRDGFLPNETTPGVGDDPAPDPSAESGGLNFEERLQREQAPARPCDRVYNERDCCKAHDDCVALRRSLRASSIKDISLDITPRLRPNLSLEEEARDRTLRLAQTPIRSWRDRSGQVIGRGQMTNFVNGRVMIDDDGEARALKFSELSDDDMCFVTAWWDIPTECVLGDEVYAARDWYATTFTWKASALCHKPLYFEEVQLERYGHTAGPIAQPVLSSAHFFLNIAALPYKMGINPPYECRYALGYYRPGSCAPWLLPPVPLSVRGGLMQAGAVFGGIYVIP